MFAIQIYLLSLLLGTLATTIGREIFEYRNSEFFLKRIIESIGLFFYAILFTIFPLLPALIVGLKFISKSNKSVIQKEITLGFISFILVLLINLIMDGYLKSIEFAIFLSALSF